MFCGGAFLLAMSWMACAVVAMPTPRDCSTASFLEDVPLKVRQMCAFLSTLYDMTNSVESGYPDDKLEPPYHANYPYERESVYDGLNSAQSKRQDMDHVFLRFGRRR